jgi:hypothetical protein
MSEIVGLATFSGMIFATPIPPYLFKIDYAKLILLHLYFGSFGIGY